MLDKKNERKHNKKRWQNRKRWQNKKNVKNVKNVSKIEKKFLLHLCLKVLVFN